MNSRLNGRVIACLAALLSLVSVSVFAQGGSTKTALSGTVVDSAGGVIPGATVVVKNTETGVTFNTITNADGAFSVPALDPGRIRSPCRCPDSRRRSCRISASSRPARRASKSHSKSATSPTRLRSKADRS